MGDGDGVCAVYQRTALPFPLPGQVGCILIQGYNGLPIDLDLNRGAVQSAHVDNFHPAPGEGEGGSITLWIVEDILRA